MTQCYARLCYTFHDIIVVHFVFHIVDNEVVKWTQQSVANIVAEVETHFT